VTESCYTNQVVSLQYQLSRAFRISCSSSRRLNARSLIEPAGRVKSPDSVGDLPGRKPSVHFAGFAARQFDGEVRKTAQCALLDVFHRQQRAVVAAAGVDRDRFHAGKGFSKLRILRDERLDQRYVVLVHLIRI